MSEQSQKVMKWRDKKRDEEGKQLVSVWLPSPWKYRLEELARQRHQTYGEVIVDALNAMEPDTPIGSASHLQQMIAQEVRREVTAQMRRYQNTVAAPVAAEPAPTPVAIIADGQPVLDRSAKEARILDMAERGFSGDKIAATLNDEGISNFSEKGRWLGQTVRNFLNKRKRKP